MEILINFHWLEILEDLPTSSYCKLFMIILHNEPYIQRCLLFGTGKEMWAWWRIGGEPILLTVILRTLLSILLHNIIEY